MTTRKPIDLTEADRALIERRVTDHVNARLLEEEITPEQFPALLAECEREAFDWFATLRN